MLLLSPELVDAFLKPGGKPELSSFRPDRGVLVKEGLWVPFLQVQAQAGITLSAEHKRELMQAISWQLGCSFALKELSERCESRGITLIAFKGCALALCFYSRLGQRVFGDIDLAVPGHQQPEFLELARSLGYEVDPSQKSLCRGATILDLHEHPMHQLQQWIAPSGEDWWRQAVVLSDSTGTTLRLSGRHEFILCLFHGAKHAFSRGNWLLDLLILAERLPLEEISEAVLSYRAQRHLWLANECAYHLLGRQFPEAVSSLGKAPSRLDPLAIILKSLICERRAPDFLGMLTPVWAIQGVLQKVLYLLELALPRPGDWRQRFRDLRRKMGQLWSACWAPRR